MANPIMIKPVPMMIHLIDNGKDEPVLPRVNYISDNSSDDRFDNKEEDRGKSKDDVTIIETAAVEDNDGPEVVSSPETTINEKVIQAMRQLNTLCNPLATSTLKDASERIVRSANIETERELQLEK